MDVLSVCRPCHSKPTLPHSLLLPMYLTLARQRPVRRRLARTFTALPFLANSPLTADIRLKTTQAQPQKAPRTYIITKNCLLCVLPPLPHTTTRYCSTTTTVGTDPCYCLLFSEINTYLHVVSPMLGNPYTQRVIATILMGGSVLTDPTSHVTLRHVTTRIHNHNTENETAHTQPRTHRRRRRPEIEKKRTLLIVARPSQSYKQQLTQHLPYQNTQTTAI